jgi:hypothetical protein
MVLKLKSLNGIRLPIPRLTELADLVLGRHVAFKTATLVSNFIEKIKLLLLPALLIRSAQARVLARPASLRTSNCRPQESITFSAVLSHFYWISINTWLLTFCPAMSVIPSASSKAAAWFTKLESPLPYCLEAISRFNGCFVGYKTVTPGTVVSQRHLPFPRLSRGSQDRHSGSVMTTAFVLKITFDPYLWVPRFALPDCRNDLCSTVL